MLDEWRAQLRLARGERLLGGWPVEPVAGDRTFDRPGYLILTSRRCLFYHRSGVSGGRLEEPPRLQWSIEEVRSVAPQTLWMRIGSDDRVEIAGLGIDGYGFRLPREMSPGPVVEAILRARDARRAELGRPPP